jgi:hypothetical protein
MLCFNLILALSCEEYIGLLNWSNRKSVLTASVIAESVTPATYTWKEERVHKQGEIQP